MEDERRILLQIIESQAAQNAKLTEQAAALTALVEELIRKLDEKNHRKTSKNSSAPPLPVTSKPNQPPRASVNPAEQRLAVRTDTREIP